MDSTDTVQISANRELRSCDDREMIVQTPEQLAKHLEGVHIHGNDVRKLRDLPKGNVNQILIKKITFLLQSR